MTFVFLDGLGGGRRVGLRCGLAGVVLAGGGRGVFAGVWRGAGGDRSGVHGRWLVAGVFMVGGVWQGVFGGVHGWWLVAGGWWLGLGRRVSQTAIHQRISPKSCLPRHAGIFANRLTFNNLQNTLLQATGGFLLQLFRPQAPTNRTATPILPLK